MPKYKNLGSFDAHNNVWELIDAQTKKFGNIDEHTKSLGTFWCPK